MSISKLTSKLKEGKSLTNFREPDSEGQGSLVAQGLVHYYDFETLDFIDQISGNNLVGINGPTLIPGIQGNAGYFPNTGSKRAASINPIGVDFTTGFSYSFWWRQDIASGPNFIIDIYMIKATGGTQFRVGCFHDSISFTLGAQGFLNSAIGNFSGTQDSSGFSGMSYALGTGWHHVVVTFNPGNPRPHLLYINGKHTILQFPWAAAPASFPPAVPKQIIYVGGSNTSGSYEVKVDEFGIWDRVLDIYDVLFLYNGGVGRTLSGGIFV